MKKIPIIEEEQAEAGNRSVVPPPIFASVHETKRLLSLGSTRVYELMNANELEKVKAGAKTLITVASIQRYAKKLIDEAAA